jgi:cyclophilin family peptidyl-prolyl cis-trans isomerase
VIQRIALVAVAMFLVVAGPAAAQNDEKRLMVLETAMGDIVIDLQPVWAPETAAQMELLVDGGVYDSTEWIRAIPGFIVQVGRAEVERLLPLDPEQSALVKNLPLETGTGGAHVRGAVSMARFDASDSGTTSWSIFTARAQHLDGDQTVFGRVIDGMPIVDAISNLPVNNRDRPLDRMLIVRAEMVPQSEIDGLELNTTIPEFTSTQVSTSVAQRANTETAVLVALYGALVCGVAAFVLAGRIDSRYVGAIALLAALSAGFGIYRILVPGASPTAGLFVFIGTFVMLRLLSRFEAV